jgi:hypothetical protein
LLTTAAPRQAGRVAANLIVQRSPGILTPAFVAGVALAVLIARWAKPSSWSSVSPPRAELSLIDCHMQYWSRQFWVSSPRSRVKLFGLFDPVLAGVWVHVLSAVAPTPVAVPLSAAKA